MFPASDEGSSGGEEISMPVFSDSPSSIVSEQPPMTREQERLTQGTRRPIPVSTIDWQTSMTSHFSPLYGLDFLQDVSQVIIQQTVELTDRKYCSKTKAPSSGTKGAHITLPFSYNINAIQHKDSQTYDFNVMATLESENRYTVKVPRGETIYYATESSTSFQRTCFGSSRAFTMRLYDPTQQEAMQFRRRLACGSCCSVFVYLQEMEVWVPPGEFIGKVVQKFNATRPSFFLCNKQYEVIYRMEGPEGAFGCLLGKTDNFKIFTGDGGTQIGSIIHQWDQVQVAYNLYMQMPGNDNNTRNKAILLAAAFLLEYMYFENAKRKGYCRCIC